MRKERDYLVDFRATRSQMGNRAMAVFITCFFTVLAA
jgi:hypothetical protein